MRVLVVDNHDSFTYNLVHDVAALTGEVPDVLRNDAPLRTPLADVLAGYDAVVVSPGPGTPENPDDLGHSAEVVAQGTVPVLGICLGMQAIARAHGARVRRAPRPVHGEVALIEHLGTGLFAGAGVPLPNPLPMVRYHSLVVDDLPSDLVADAWCDGLVMALHHRDRPLWGVQTHPESICSEHGRDLLAAFLRLADAHRRAAGGESGEPRGSHAGTPRGPAASRVDPSPASREDPSPAWRVDTSPASRPDPAARRVLARRVRCTAPAEVVFDRLVRDQDHAWWLDSVTAQTRPDHSMGVGPSDPGRSGSPGRSGRSAGSSARFSACGSAAGPLARIATALPDGTVRVVDAGGIHHVEGDLLDVVDADLGDPGVDPVVVLGQVPADARPPFLPGWVGYLGYEFCTELLVGEERGDPALCAVDTAGDAGADGGPHVAEDEDTDRAVFVWSDRVVVLDHAGHAWVCAVIDGSADGDGEGGIGAAQRAWISETADVLAGSVSESAAPAPPPVGPRVRAEDVTVRHDRQAYLRMIDRCLDLIVAGESYELCLTNRITVEAEGLDRWQLYRRLRHTSPRPFGAYLSFGEVGVLSASPERFLSVDAAGRVEAKPIKGTRPRGETPQEDAALAADLASCVKERAENLMIVDLLRHDLSRVCRPGTLKVPVLFDVETHAGVHQLVSTIRGELDPQHDVTDALRAALPGGSMTGAPKERTVRLLRDLEGGSRGVYSGVIGYVSITGEADFSIVIRSIVHRQDRLTYGVGGAITARSDARAEWVETLVKAQTLGSALGLDITEVLDL